MGKVKKYWYLAALMMVTFGLGILAMATGQLLSRRQSIAPTVPQVEPKAVEPQCSYGFTIFVSPTPTPTTTPVPTNTPTPTRTPTPTQTPSPTPVPQCGQICTATCANGLTCYATTGRCVLPACLIQGTVCSTDKCTLIPPTPTPTPTNTPTSTLTPTPTLVLRCVNIKIYKSVADALVDITVTLRAGTAGVKSGDTVVLAVEHNNATAARFTVNGVLVSGTPVDASGEFMIDYVLPDITQSTQFIINAEVYRNGIWL